MGNKRIIDVLFDDQAKALARELELTLRNAPPMQVEPHLKPVGKTPYGPPVKGKGGKVKRW